MRHCTFGAMALTCFSLTLVPVVSRPLARLGLERALSCPLQNLQSFPCHIYTAAKRVQTLEMERPSEAKALLFQRRIRPELA